MTDTNSSPPRPQENGPLFWWENNSQRVFQQCVSIRWLIFTQCVLRKVFIIRCSICVPLSPNLCLWARIVYRFHLSWVMKYWFQNQVHCCFCKPKRLRTTLLTKFLFLLNFSLCRNSEMRTFSIHAYSYKYMSIYPIK